MEFINGYGEYNLQDSEIAVFREKDEHLAPFLRNMNHDEGMSALIRKLE